jgi:UDP-N-acetyl-D-glucosamine dehydrogenase
MNQKPESNELRIYPFRFSPMLWSDYSYMTCVELLPERLSNYDCVLIAADHTSYEYGAIVRNPMLVVDTRKATRHTKQNRDKVAHC